MHVVCSKRSQTCCFRERETSLKDRRASEGIPKRTESRATCSVLSQLPLGNGAQNRQAGEVKGVSHRWNTKGPMGKLSQVPLRHQGGRGINLRMKGGMGKFPDDCNKTGHSLLGFHDHPPNSFSCPGKAPEMFKGCCRCQRLRALCMIDSCGE